VKPSDWGSDNRPDYTGLKRTPYLNELELRFNMSADAEKISGPDPETGAVVVKYSYFGTYAVGAEMVDMFRNSLSGDKLQEYSIKVFGTMDFDYSLPKADGQSVIQEWKHVT